MNMQRDRLSKILDDFKDKKILIIGDIMLDKYVLGEVSRISPEAPVQIIDVIKENYVPGGAANVANNIVALDGNTFITGVIGQDEAGSILNSELEKRSINTKGIVVDPKKPTIQKVRIIGKNQQLLRIDYEDTRCIEDDMEKQIINYVREMINDIDAVIISDYAKGTITKTLVRSILRSCKQHNKILIVDPKPKHMEYYQDVTLITPNHKEASEMVGIEEKGEEDLVEIGKRLQGIMNTTILITRGEKGMSLFEKGDKITHIPTRAKEVYDVSGAGDTVVGTLALAMTTGAKLKEAAILANHAAGITVGKLGTSTVTVDEIKKDLRDE